ncbi:hypothetical protein N7493_005938 [Penicillium malachiteum]|uniref:FAD-binding domain-containing protein n=1 Tax=Penicillium malachiteum TaxID=1324776 RepID=A0AAD6MVV7_9EURO|nr:hypothetical protein N7493_005938 [Penicillium malachiteum]
MSNQAPFVLIVGAGPSGLILALMLGKKGIPVRLLEASECLDDRPRATHYSPPAVYELHRAGLLEDMKAEGGFTPNGVCWRKLNGEVIASIPTRRSEESPSDPMVCLPLNKLKNVLQRQISKLPHVEILYSHKVTGVGQDESKAWVEVDAPGGPQKLEAQYIAGCDGANSQVRRSLFGDMEFPGFTWDEQIVATNTYYPFEKHGFDWDSNFIIDPEHWFMAARISNDGLWRVTYGEVPGLSFKELKARQPTKFKAFLPGHPDPTDYKMVNFSPYKIHQRLAKRMRVGRVLLAADAAHLCNPFGGLGLTGGIVDVGGLSDCLDGIYTARTDDDILDIYDTIRREKYNNIVDPVSTANIRLLFEQDPETASVENEFLKTCKAAEMDPEVGAALGKAANALQYDFRQHYRK